MLARNMSGNFAWQIFRRLWLSRGFATHNDPPFVRLTIRVLAVVRLVHAAKYPNLASARPFLIEPRIGDPRPSRRR